MVGTTRFDVKKNNRLRAINETCSHSMRYILGFYFIMTENNGEVKELLENMNNFFGHEIPSPINFPITFKYYLKMYKEYANNK
jgi:hypothetical protein